MFFALFCAGVAFSQSSGQKIDALLNNANSYYWLSRSRQNTLFDAVVSKHYLDSAAAMLGAKEIDSVAKAGYTSRIKAQRDEINHLIEVSYGNLNGKYPIYMQISGQLNDQYEFRDDPEEICIENALDELLQSNTNKTNRALNELLAFCIVEVRSENPVLREVVKQYLNNYSKLYVVPEYELNKITGTDHKQLPDSLLHKVGAYYNSNTIGKVVVTVYDSLPELKYCGVRFELIDVRKGEVLSSTVTEALRVDKKEAYGKFWAEVFPFFLLIFLFVCLPFAFFVYYKDRRAISFAWAFVFRRIVYLAAGIGLGFVGSIGGLYALSLFAPEASAFLYDPLSRIWPIVFSVLLALLLPSAFIVLQTLLLKRRLVDQRDALFLFTIGLLSGIFVKLYLEYFICFEQSWALTYLLVTAFLVNAMALVLADWYHAFYKEKFKFIKLLIPVIVLSFPLLVPVVFYLYLSPEFQDMPNFMSYAALSFLPVVGYYLYPKFRSKWQKNTEQKKESVSAVLEEFQKFLNKQTSDYGEKKTVCFNDAYEDKFKELVLSDSPAKFLHLSGDAGIGKTMLINKFIVDSDDNVKIFYGDCDQDPGGNPIPYEPFHQAFKDVLGEGRFDSGDIGAGKVLKKVSTVAGHTAAGGILDSLTSSIDGNFKGARVDEIMNVLNVYFNELVKKEKEQQLIIVFVLEDIQWLDDKTEELFKEFVNRMAVRAIKEDFKFSVVTTEATSNGATKGESAGNRVKEWLGTKAKESEQITESKWSGAEGEFPLNKLSGRTFVSEILKKEHCDVFIAPNSIEAINKNIGESDGVNPRHVLQVLGVLIKKGWFTDENNVLTLSDEVRWDSIPLRADEENYYFDKFKALDKELLKFLGSAAFIGLKFEAAVLSKLWKIERLELIHMLLEVEKEGLVIDLSDKDDWYAFTSKKVRDALKRFVIKDADQGKNPQIVKEYHKEIINIALGGENISLDNTELLFDMDLDQLCNLSERMDSIRNERENEAQIMFAVAGVRCFDKARLLEAERFFSKVEYTSLELFEKLPEALLCKIKMDIRTKSYNDDKEKMNEELGETLEAVKRIVYSDSSSKQNEANMLEVIHLLMETNLQLTANELKQDDFEVLAEKYPFSKGLLKFYMFMLDSNWPNPYNKEQTIQLKAMKDVFEEPPYRFSRSHGIFISQLSKVIEPKEAIELQKLRFRIITGVDVTNEDIDTFISSIEKVKELECTFDQLEDLSYLTSNFYHIADKNECDILQKLRLNEKRLRLNQAINNDFGIYLSQLELAKLNKEKAKYSSAKEDFEYAFGLYFSLFYTFSESSKRIFIYPDWIELCSVKEFSAIDRHEIDTATKTMGESGSSKSNDDLELPTFYATKLSELLQDVSDKKVKEVLENLLQLVKN